jgi:O-antigen/teichoic acid export membrane protein
MSVIRKNIFWLLVSQAATWVATFVGLLIVPNKLGSTDMGTIGYAIGFVQFFTLAAGLGTSVFLSREIARDHKVLGGYVWNALLLKFVLWGALSAAAVGLALALGNRGDTLLLIAIGCAGMLPTILNEVFTGALAGIQRMARPALWLTAQVYFQTIVGVLVLELGAGMVAYAAVVSLGTLIPTVANGAAVRHLVGHASRRFEWATWRLLVLGGIPLLTLSFLTLIYGTLDVPILHSLVGSEPVGWYVVAMRWVGIPVFITTAVVGATFPAFSQHGKPLTDHFAVLVNRSIHIVLLVTIPSAVGLFFVAGDMIHLFYDDGYESSIVLMQILAIGVPLISLDTVLGTALVACDRLKRYLLVAGSAAVMNPIVCFFAIHVADDRWGNGAIGAAIATVFTELWIMVGALLLKTPGVLDRAELARVARILAASALMVPALILGSNLPLVVEVGLGIVAYAVGSLVFGSVDRSDVTGLLKATRRRGSLGEEPETGDVVLETSVGPLAVPVVPSADEDEPVEEQVVP